MLRVQPQAKRCSDWHGACYFEEKHAGITHGNVNT